MEESVMKHQNVRGIALCLSLLVIIPGVLLAQNPNCTIMIPDNPLSQQGLATAYQLMATNPNDGNGPCDETNFGSSAFVQAAIFDPATGQISVYNPLVVNADNPNPAQPIVVPTLPDNAIVALWFGFNGNNLIQAASSDSVLQNAHCVNGLAGGNIFGQFSYCNAEAFFKAANQAIRSGRLHVPHLGIGTKDHLLCPSVRDFFVVDQDQSDNLPVTYLNFNGQTAQNTQLNAMAGGVVFGNPSDNGLLDRFLDPTIGCTPWKVSDLADPGQVVPALALNELQARAWQRAPVALIPAGDPMAQDNNASMTIDLDKVNAYRRGVDQPLARSFAQADTARYCRNMLRFAPPRLLQDKKLLLAAKSPVLAIGDTLFTFMAARFVASYQLLHCGDFVPIPDPITVTTDAGGAAIDATINVSLYKKGMHYIAPYDRWDRDADDDAKESRHE
jgi:hypothetical protein